MKMLDSKIVVGQDVESLGVLENLGEIVRLYIPKATAEYIALYIAHSICREVGENSLYIEVHLEQGGVGKGFMHIVGGILAINVVATIRVISNTLGFGVGI